MVQLCICSSKRHLSIVKKTLTTLRKAGVDTVVNIVVPHEEIEAYRAALEHSPVSTRLIVSDKGLVKQRKTFRQMAPEGEKIFFIDDDITAIKVKGADKLYHLTNLNALIDIGFSLLGDSLLWSVYPLTNFLFMKHQVARGNCYCVGAMYGIINDPRLKEPEIDECEDYARQLSEQAQGRPPIRLDFVGLQTRYYKNAGGLQQARSYEVRHSTILNLEEWYPMLVKSVMPKSKIPDLRFLQRSVKEPYLAATDALIAQSTPATPPSL
jgi:hypothetical protein